MRIKKPLLIVALSALALAVVSSQAALSDPECVEGWLSGPSDRNYWLDGFASDYIGYTVVAYADPDWPLDIELCVGLALPVGGGYYRVRWLDCEDRNGPGEPETVRVHIGSSDFPGLDWLLSARLAFMVHAVSGHGRYILCVWLE